MLPIRHPSTICLKQPPILPTIWCSRLRLRLQPVPRTSAEIPPPRRNLRLRAIHRSNVEPRSIRGQFSRPGVSGVPKLAISTSSIVFDKHAEPFRLLDTDPVDHSGTALPGILDLSQPSVSRLHDNDLQLKTERLLTSIATGLRSRISVSYLDSTRKPSRISQQLLASTIKTSNSKYIRDLWDKEPKETKHFLRQDLLAMYLDDTNVLCVALPVIISSEADLHGLSFDLVRYLYHQCMLEGLPFATISPRFYECLLELSRIRGPEWTHYTLCSLPYYFLFRRCPSRLLPELRRTARLDLGQNHFEQNLLQVHVLAGQGKVIEAGLQFKEVEQSVPYVQDTVEYQNALIALLEAAENHLSREDIAWLMIDVLKAKTMTSTIVAPVLMPFITRNHLHSLLRHIWHTMGDSVTPAVGILQLNAMRESDSGLDQLDRLFSIAHHNSDHREYSYALRSAMAVFKNHQLNTGGKSIFRHLLNFVQKHANVEILVRMGVAHSIESKDKPYLDGLMTALLLATYFKEQKYTNEAVMSAYNKLKQMKYEDEVFRMAAFPGPQLFNVFIMAFSHMAKEHLVDALDVLAEVTHNHDPIKNVPHSISDRMKNPKSLHTGPDAYTYKNMISTFVRHGQLEAAERCLAEIWRKWPDHYDRACDTVISGYVERGRHKEAGFLLTRKINAGHKITERTLRVLTPVLKTSANAGFSVQSRGRTFR